MITTNPTYSTLADKRSSRGGTYRSSKSYDHAEGLSCCFRQWRATGSHCKYLHGYALAFRFVFASFELDERNWCFDFGGLKFLKEWLHKNFDHILLVANDDPSLPHLLSLADNQLAQVRIMPAVGCEAIAQFVFDEIAPTIKDLTIGRVWLESVQVSEHAGNSAMYGVVSEPLLVTRDV